MSGFSHVLVADNSSGMQFLHVQGEYEDAFDFCVAGTVNGEDIQINFDTINRFELNQFIEMLEFLRDEDKSNV